MPVRPRPRSPPESCALRPRPAPATAAAPARCARRAPAAAARAACRAAFHQPLQQPRPPFRPTRCPALLRLLLTRRFLFASHFSSPGSLRPAASRAPSTASPPLQTRSTPVAHRPPPAEHRLRGSIATRSTAPAPMPADGAPEIPHRNCHIQFHRQSRHLGAERDLFVFLRLPRHRNQRLPSLALPLRALCGLVRARAMLRPRRRQWMRCGHCSEEPCRKMTRGVEKGLEWLKNCACRAPCSPPRRFTLVKPHSLLH